MDKTKSKAAATTASEPADAAAPKPALKFPSVTTRLPAAQAGASYNNKGIPFPYPAGSCVMNLQDFFGQAAINTITASGKLIFHSMGDSGVGGAAQEAVAEALALDINNQNHELGASFLLHLGDVMYGPNKEANYLDKFYRVYDHYDRLVFAIPGNHDGEILAKTDLTTLAAFKENFCAPAGTQPPVAKQYGVLMPNQPGPYWHLQAPFVDIIGLYSNADEDTGIISNAKVGSKQKTWLQGRLTAIAQARKGAQRKALVLAMHHPPYARGFQASGYGHPGSPEMTQDIDDCCTQAGILPDAVMAGHTHSYQHYVRTQKLNGASRAIPYLIVGTGGISLQKIPAPTGVKNSAGDVLYYSAFKDYGYLTVTATAAQLRRRQ
ncbi:MAG TPA: metallophosphoesterase [Verrucomicrobiae bacterium]|jgi:predicted phosphodiesterase